MSALADFPFSVIAERGSIHDNDVAELRRSILDSDGVSAAEAEQLMALSAQCAVQAPEWAEAVRDVLVDFVVHRSQPDGYITQENAEWLIGALAPEGYLTSRRDLDLILAVMDEARWSPAILIAFALEQVRLAVVANEGPLRRPEHAHGRIRDEDVELVRGMIYAFGGDGSIAITRAEAGLLCDINDALDPDNPNEAWTELYIKAMANFLLANSGYAPPSREEALRNDIWLENRNEITPLEVVKSVAKLSLDDVMGIYRSQSKEECSMARLDRQYREMVTGEVLDGDEAEWLIERLNRDGRLTEAELALIAYVRENAVEIDPRFEEHFGRHLDAA